MTTRREFLKVGGATIAAFYIDGHVRVYHGEQTKLPKHYVSREKLCSRATVDYWVNAMDGQPFFVINKAVDSGLLQVLEHEIVPKLEKRAPLQEIYDDKTCSRFAIIFDRDAQNHFASFRTKFQCIAEQIFHQLTNSLCIYFYGRKIERRSQFQINFFPLGNRSEF